MKNLDAGVIETKTRFQMLALMGVGVFGLFVGCAGSVAGNKGLVKALAFFSSAGAFAGAAGISKAAAHEGAIAQDALQVDREKRKQMSLIEAETDLDIAQALLEESAIRELSNSSARPALESPASAFEQMFVSPPETEEDLVTVEAQSVAPKAAVTVVASPRAPKPVSGKMPDGAILVQPSDVGDINRYPGIMAIAGMGAGKTSTVRYLFQQMGGTTIFASPKATDQDIGQWDIVFGYDPLRDESGDFGDASLIDADNPRDLLEMGDDSESTTIIEFVWGVYSTIKLRQQQGHHRLTDADSLRVFFDESAYVYSCGYADPLDSNSKAAKAAQSIIRIANRSALFDGRSNRVQVVWGSQSESVDSIGLQGVSAARDDMWHLYPGSEAIAAAEKHNKSALASWFRRRLKEGLAIALLEKQGIFFHALDLPMIKDLG